MKTENIKNKFKIEVEKFKKFFQQIDNPEPDRDWFALFFIFVVIFFIISIWSIALYLLYFPTKPAVQAITSSYGSVDEKKLSAILKAYEDRKNNFEALQKNPPVFVDPSI